MTPDASTAATALLAVHSVDEFVFSVPDLEAARQFYASFGLDVRDEDGGLALYAFGHPQRWGRIRQAAGRKRLLWLSLGIHGDAPRFAERLDQQGIARITAPAGADDGGIWIAGPDGLPLQLRAAPKSSPSAPAPQTPPQPCANAGRAPPAAARRAFSRCTCRTSCCSAPMWRGPRASMWTCSACACRTRPAT